MPANDYHPDRHLDRGDAPEDYPAFPHPRKGHPAFVGPDSKAKHEARLRWYEAWAVASGLAHDEEPVARIRGERESDSAVVSLLSASPTPIYTIEQMAHATGMGFKKTRATLRRLTESGRINKRCRGAYRLVAEKEKAR